MPKKKVVKSKPSKKKSISKKTTDRKPNKFSISERAKKISQPSSTIQKIRREVKEIEKPVRVEKPIQAIKKLPLKPVQNEVNSVSMRKQSSEKIGTGISGYDAMTHGGFENHSINLIAGGSGSGKSIFSLQFLLEGLRKGESVLYISFEEKKEDFYKYMNDFSWDLKRAEQAGKFFFLEYSPEKVKQMLDEGGGTIESIVLKYNIKRIVIDSLTSFSLMFDDELSKRQSILGLFDILRKWDCTTLLTIQHNPLNRDDRGISPSEFEADSITLLYNVKIGQRRERLIEVLKMRGEDHSKELHSFIIKKGIQVGPMARSRPF